MKRRLLLRTCTEVSPEDARLPQGRYFFHMENKSGGLGYDKVPGRAEHLGTNEYANVPTELAEMFPAAQRKQKRKDVTDV